MNSTGYKEIGKYVDEYIIKKKLTQEDYFTYLQHACDCLKKINRHHSNKTITAKVSVSSLGIIEFPSDMVGFCNVFIPLKGEWWSMTRKPRKVMTTTFTGTLEGQDADMGEGVDVLDDQYWGLGGRGGVNSYYINIDFNARRIFCDGFKSDVAVLQYTSSGLVIDGNTYVDQQCEPVLDAYIAWQMEIISPRSMGMIRELKENYNEELFQMRLVNFMPSRDEIADSWDSSSTQSIQR